MGRLEQLEWNPGTKVKNLHALTSVINLSGKLPDWS